MAYKKDERYELWNTRWQKRLNHLSVCTHELAAELRARDAVNGNRATFHFNAMSDQQLVESYVAISLSGAFYPSLRACFIETPEDDKVRVALRKYLKSANPFHAEVAEVKEQEIKNKKKLKITAADFNFLRDLKVKGGSQSE